MPVIAEAITDDPDSKVAPWVGADTSEKKFVGVPLVTRNEKLSYCWAESVPSLELSSNQTRKRVPPFVQSREMLALRVELPAAEEVVFNPERFVQLLATPERLK